MTRSLKLLLASIFLLATFSFAFISPPADDVLTKVISKLIAYHANRPQEKVFIHLDKPLYAAGEDLWFKSYLVDGTYHRLDSSISSVVYVELLNSDHAVIQRDILYSPGGVAFGDFHLDEALPEGKYLIRAYTNYMRNGLEDFFFQKEITILNPDKARDAGGENLQADIDLQFFPEGGNLISGVENRIAFKAINQSGRSVDVEGEMVDDQNAVVATFKTSHQGMGSFKGFIWANKSYTARLKNPGSGKTFKIPSSQEKGYMMQVVDAGQSIKVFIYNNSEKSAANPVLFNLVGQSRGEVYFAAKGEIKSTSVTTSIPKNKFPRGIAQITLFDGDGTPQCERLVFINNDTRLQVALAMNKASYSKREKVDVSLQVTNEKNEPVTGNFSVSIYDKSAIDGQDEYPFTIEDYLLLTSDLTGYIENPGYYFADNTPERAQNLDLLMMTHGWRRFTWKKILNDELPPLNHYAENGLTLSGKITKTGSEKPLANSKLKLLNNAGEMILTETDAEGKFYTDAFTHIDSSKIVIQTENAKGKQQDFDVQVNPFNSAPSSSYRFPLFEQFNSAAFSQKIATKEETERSFNLQNDTKMLEAIEVQSTKLDESPKAQRIYGTPSASVSMKDVKNQAYMHIFQVLQARVPGVTVKGTPPSMSITLRAGGAASGSPLLLIDGTPVDADAVSSLNPSDVESVDVLRGPSAAVFGSRGQNGVIAIYTKRGQGISTSIDRNKHIKYHGFYAAREFYSPQYDVPSEFDSRPDLRTTLYWNPLIETDEQGKAQVSFFTSDVVADYEVIVQGISYTGYPGWKVTTLKVN
jgi:TonB-dependent SusC/RagA subfamily outer membrane receptor